MWLYIKIKQSSFLATFLKDLNLKMLLKFAGFKELLTETWSFFRHASKAARGRPYAPVPGGPPQCKVFTDLPDYVFSMLLHLGPHLSTDPILMAKILRISKGFMKDVSKGFLNVLTLKILSDSFSFYSFLLSKLKQYLRLRVWGIQEKLVVHVLNNENRHRSSLRNSTLNLR